MRAATVRSGLTAINAAIIVIMATSFGHEWLGRLFFLSYDSEMRLIVSGLFWGGMLGGLGAVVTVFGLFRSPGGRPVRIFPMLMLLTVIVFVYFVLLYSTLEHPSPPRISPRETITI